MFIRAHGLQATFRPIKKIYIDRYMRRRQVVCASVSRLLDMAPYFNIWQKCPRCCFDAGPNDFLMVRTVTESMLGMIA